MAFQLVLLLAIMFEDGGIQIQTLTAAALRQESHLPLGRGIEETTYIAHAKTVKRLLMVASMESWTAQQGLQGAVVA